MNIHTVVHSIRFIRLYLSIFIYLPLVYGVTLANIAAGRESASDYPPLNSPGSTQPPGDTVRSYTLDEITIRVLRFRPVEIQSPSSVSVIEKPEIDRRFATSLSGVVSTVPGLFIKDYGSSSGLKTISQRGLGAEHTLVMLNGMRVSSFQNGLLDFGLFPSSEIERVEVLHGGNSAAFGSDAVGGVINILTYPHSASPSLDLESSFGSFGYQRYHIAGGMSSPEAGFRVGLQDERSVDNFDFEFHNGPSAVSLSRQNADFSSRYGTAQGFFVPSENMELDLFAQGYTSDRGVPGPA